VVDADLKGFPSRLNVSCVGSRYQLFRAVARMPRPWRFDTIPKDRLLALVKQHISDSRMLRLLKLFLDHNILEELRECTPVAGVPQGAVLSPVLSNLYLNPLDHQMADEGFEMVRYADDFVVLCRCQVAAESALQMITAWVAEAGLTLHPTKTKIVDSRVNSFAFLGDSFRGDQIFPRRESLAKMKARVVELTPRKRSGSINPSTTNWIAVCGRIACPVGRQGRQGSPAQLDFPTPISLSSLPGLSRSSRRSRSSLGGG